MGVGHGFERGEGFGRDDEERLGRVEIADRFHEIGAIDIGDKTEGHVAVAVIFQRLVSHYRTEIGAADPDINDVANALAGVSLPFAGADAAGEFRHLIEDGVDLGHDVFAVQHNRFVFGRAEGHVQHGAMLGEVNFVSAKHGVDLRAQARLLGQLEEEAESLLRDAILRIVEEDTHGFGGHALAALGVFREQASEM